MASSTEFLGDGLSYRLGEPTQTLPVDNVSHWMSKMAGYAALFATCGLLAKAVL